MSSFKDKINMAAVPEHIAIIMDGNGRWAKARGQERFYGHIQGVQTVRNITEAATEAGVKYLTLYAFSTENWNRPKDEVEALMKLLVKTIENETERLNANNVRLTTIGDTMRLPEPVRLKFEECMKSTENNTGTTLNIALSYSARWEITEMARKISQDVKNGLLDSGSINDSVVASYMTTKAMPDPEILIRTSGEYRISNFLLWQIAYTELYFTPVMWPDFTKEDFFKIIADFQTRERRFGKTGEQIEKI
ncbi:MAG: isoprenyl transferase [Paludibacteraceae bacterium]|nr:isoprenyl transferase [Paludibacteraceae bacterium]